MCQPVYRRLMSFMTVCQTSVQELKTQRWKLKNKQPEDQTKQKNRRVKSEPRDLRKSTLKRITETCSRCSDVFIPWHCHRLPVGGLVIPPRPWAHQRQSLEHFVPSHRLVGWVRSFFCLDSFHLYKSAWYESKGSSYLPTGLWRQHLSCTLNWQGYVFPYHWVLTFIPRHLFLTPLSVHSPKTHWVMTFITQRWKYCYLWLQSGCHQT